MVVCAIYIWFDATRFLPSTPFRDAKGTFVGATALACGALGGHTSVSPRSAGTPTTNVGSVNELKPAVAGVKAVVVRLLMCVMQGHDTSNDTLTLS